MTRVFVAFLMVTLEVIALKIALHFHAVSDCAQIISISTRDS